MPLGRLLLLLFVALVAAVLSPRGIQAQGSDVIRGRITGPDSLPLDGARVTVVSINTLVERTQRTDKAGRFTIIFPGSDGQYVVTVSQLGYLVKTFELKRTADQDILIADARLEKVQLEPVVVTADVRGTIPRGTTSGDISGTAQGIGAGGLLPDQQGNLAAMAASLPGVLLIPGMGGADGFSVLGLDPSDNTITLNGMTFEGGNLPRDAGIASQLTTSPYDVSRGGFSGGELSLRSPSGSNLIRQGMSLNMNLPQLHWSDLSSRAVGNEKTALSLSGVASGPLKLNTSYYNMTFQYDRSRNPLQTLLNTSPFGLQSAGISSDSVARMLDVLDDLGVPFALGTPSRKVQQDNASFLGSFSFNPPSSVTGAQYGITVNANWGHTTPEGGGGFAQTLPASQGQSRNQGAGIQLRHTAYLKIFLTETGFSLSANESNRSPFVNLPAGNVRVNSLLDDGTTKIQNLSFGGNQQANSQSRQVSANVTNNLSWFSTNNKHRLQLATGLRFQKSSSESSTNLLGTFRYNSLADLENGVPASYSRQLNERLDESSQLTAYASLGDSYRVNPDLQFQYGLRVDGGKYFIRPDNNPLIESTFGVRNDFVPSKLYFSPRIGFTKTLGTAPQLSAFEGAVRGPRAVLRGGIAVQQNQMGSISSVVNNTGLPNAIQTLNCVGPATPIADWDLYLTNPELIPNECADGTGGTIFSSSSPSVTLYSRDYMAPTSVRSNLSWNGSVLDNRFRVTLSGTHSLNLHRASNVDLNFDPTVRFTLANEADRPVFVQPTSIVEGTGAIASRDARVSQSFSKVNEMRSDLRSETIQFQINLTPVFTNPYQRFRWSGSYIFQDVREQQRGFSSTVGNPLDVYWSRGTSTARHQISYNLSYEFFRFARVTWNGKVTSGRPYTPTIQGDVNGDGSSNDRPFIFDPANTADAAVAAGMQNLLSRASGDARDCLRKQLGRLAARNSCEAGWELTGNLGVTIDQARLRLPHRAQLQIAIENPMGGLDMLFNGTKNPRGWGQPKNETVDNALLYVRGFDPQTNTFKYEVNERFGAAKTGQQRIKINTGITAMVSMDVGPSRERQTLTRNLRYGRTDMSSPKIPESSYRTSGTSAVPNPIPTIMRLQDSLQLTSVQADSIATLNRKYTVRLDSIWAVAAKHLNDMPTEYSDGDAWQKYLVARRAAVDLLSVVGPAVRSLLTASQLRKLPAAIHNGMDPRYLTAIRNGTSVYTSPAVGLGGASGVVQMIGGEMMIVR